MHLIVLDDVLVGTGFTWDKTSIQDVQKGGSATPILQTYLHHLLGREENMTMVEPIPQGLLTKMVSLIELFPSANHPCPCFVQLDNNIYLYNHFQ